MPPSEPTLTPRPEARPTPSPAGWRFALAAGLALLALAWAYWPTLATMADLWAHNPQYSHGFLVPVFALVVLWQRRDQFPATGLRPGWGGLGLLAAAGALRLVAAYVFYDYVLDPLSLVPAVAGLVWVLAGWPVLRWSWPAVAFLGFMLPLPAQVEGMLAQPLRSLATVASTYALQTLGYPALSEGNYILIEDSRLGVADACSGLGMLMTFFALSTAVALILQRRWADKLIVVASAVPIALVANVARITLTGVVHRAWGADAGRFVHDHAGWVMMPLALGLLWLELRYLNWVLIDTEPPQPLALHLPPAAPPPAPLSPDTPAHPAHRPHRPLNRANT